MGRSRKQAESKTVVVDLKSLLESSVDTTGVVRTEYGGFEIEILDPIKFPWNEVFTNLLKHDYEIWIKLKDEKPAIVACVRGD